jgi:hypothetical protein
MLRKVHRPEEIITRLHEAEMPLGQGRDVPQIMTTSDADSVSCERRCSLACRL